MSVWPPTQASHATTRAFAAELWYEPRMPMVIQMQASADPTATPPATSMCTPILNMPCRPTGLARNTTDIQMPTVWVTERVCC